jgi:hypothetical protein
MTLLPRSTKWEASGFAVTPSKGNAMTRPWAMLPVDEVKIKPVKMNDIGLGKSIYTKKQLDDFAAFQDSQGTRKAYLAETAELAYTGRNEK